MSTASRFLEHEQLESLRGSFNRLVRGLPSEWNIAAIQLQADNSYHDMFEHLEGVQKKKSAFSANSLELYQEAIEDYETLLHAGIKLMAYYEGNLDAAKLKKEELKKAGFESGALDKTIETNKRHLAVLSRYYEEIIKPNYESLQELPQIMLKSLIPQAISSYNEAHRINALTERCYIPIKYYEEVFQKAMIAHHTVLGCLTIMAKNIEMSENPNKEKLQRITRQYQDASQNLIILQHSLSEYRRSHEKQEYRSHDSHSFTSSDQYASSGSEEEFGLYDQASETAPNAQGSSSDSQEEFTSESPDYAVEPTAKAKPDAEMTKSEGKSPTFFTAANENKRPKQENQHKAASLPSATPR